MVGGVAVWLSAEALALLPLPGKSIGSVLVCGPPAGGGGGGGGREGEGHCWGGAKLIALAPLPPPPPPPPLWQVVAGDASPRHTPTGLRRDVEVVGVASNQLLQPSWLGEWVGRWKSTLTEVAPPPLPLSSQSHCLAQPCSRGRGWSCVGASPTRHWWSSAWRCVCCWCGGRGLMAALG